MLDAWLSHGLNQDLVGGAEVLVRVRDLLADVGYRQRPCHQLQAKANTRRDV